MMRSEAATIPLAQIRELIARGMIGEAMTLLNIRHQSGMFEPGTLLAWSTLASSSTFPFLGIIGCRKERALYGTSDCEFFERALLEKLLGQRNSVKNQFAPITIIAVDPRNTIPKSDRENWYCCVESLALQRNARADIVLITYDSSIAREITHPLLRTILLPQNGEGLRGIIDVLPNVIAESVGSIISFVREPTTIFSEFGLMFVGAAFAAKPEVEILQSERVMYGIDGCAAQTRHPLPCWSQNELLDKNRLETPVGVFCEKGVFWKREVLLREGFPISPNVTEGFAYDLAVRLSGKYLPYTIRSAVVLDSAPIIAKSYTISPRYVLDAKNIRANYLKEFGQTNTRTAPAIIEVGPTMEPSGVLPRIAPMILKHGETSRLKISVVTAVLNDREHIERCIDSVLSQNYPNLEYIVIDGGSTDGTVEVIRKYERYLTSWNSEKDSGHYYAVNKGMIRTTGEILTWINSDDYLTPYSLRVVSSIFSQQQAIRWLTGQHAYTNLRGSLDIAAHMRFYDGQEYLDGDFDSPYIQQEGTFWRRELWEKCGGALDVRLSLAADLELWTRFFQETYLTALNVPLGVFVTRPGQRSVIDRTKYLVEAVRVIESLKARGVLAAKVEMGVARQLALPLEIEFPRIQAVSTGV